TEVYQKPMNSYQYIPWLSFHPVWVKASFVHGVLLAYVRSSSRYDDFLGSRLKFYYRLRARGYPPRWLNKQFFLVDWHRDRASTLVDRIKAAPLDRGPLIYKVEYNPVWDYVDMPLVWKQTFGRVAKDDLPSLLGDRPSPVRPFRKPRSLGDLLNGLNKRALSGYQ
ncbi:hypothetical protein BCR35DRAFT_256241, partial [Leucosporidium creatinivorum]